MLSPKPGLAISLFLVCAHGQLTHSVFSSEQKHFGQPRYCSSWQVLMEEQRYQLFPVRSKLHCVVLCRLDKSCVSFIYDKVSRLCHLGDSLAYENCSNMETGPHTSLFYQEPLLCGEGEITGPSGLCSCAPGFTGNPCTRYIHDCDDVYKYGDWHGDGIYTVKPLSSPQPFQVHCRYISNARLGIMTRKKKSGRENFTRPWEDYRDGFGKITSDFWIGLEKLHALTSADRSYKLRVNIKLVNASIIVHSYEDFKVTDQSTGYRLHFNTSNLNGPDDCLLALLHAPFSTFDHDQDANDEVNCAEVRKGGFWFRGAGCSTCNPNGVIYGDNSGLLVGAEDEAFWAFLGNVAPYKIYMYIVPTDLA